MKLPGTMPSVGSASDAAARQIRCGGISFSSTCARIAAGLLLVCLVSAFPARGAQKGNTKVELLIARNEVQDPFFHHSVVLMLPTLHSQLIVGLIINKPTRVTLGRLFPESPVLQGKTDRAYFGGPVDIGVPCIIFRSSAVPKNALRLYGNVYLTFDARLITGAFQEPQAASALRLYLGRAQWSPNQLRNEIREGSWYRLQAEGSLLFSPHPEALWLRLHTRAAPSKYIRYRLPARSPRSSGPNSAAM